MHLPHYQNILVVLNKNLPVKIKSYISSYFLSIEINKKSEVYTYQWTGIFKGILGINKIKKKHDMSGSKKTNVN